jgi:HEAT repeat protein
MKSASLDDLFAQTLVGDYDAEESWEAVRALRSTGSREVFDRAARWCSSPNPLERARGADVLAQLGKTEEHPTVTYAEDSFLAVSKLLEAESERQPLTSAIYALGHLDQPLAIPVLEKFVSNPDPETRYAVAFALGSFADDPIAAGLLLQLVSDEDGDVRDWATFGIGTLSKIDSDEIREVLGERLFDPVEDVVEEALVGLARRRDQRVLPALLSALEKPEVYKLTIEAAREMLDVQDDEDELEPEDYIAALHAQFGNCNR